MITRRYCDEENVKKMTAGILSAMIAVLIFSIPVLAAKKFSPEPYSLGAGKTSGPILYLADDNYMYFNTRPTSGAGGVSLSVSGPGVHIAGELFPYQVSRSPLRIHTSSGIGNYYTVYLTAGSTAVSGTLNAWTSSN